MRVVIWRLRKQKARSSDYLWQFVDGRPIQNEWETMAELPAQTAHCQRAMSKALKTRRLQFCRADHRLRIHAAVGMVNDHTCYLASGMQSARHWHLVS